jgi:hypothetical protein
MVPEVRKRRLSPGEEVDVGARVEHVDPVARSRVCAQPARDDLVLVEPARVADDRVRTEVR